MKISERSLEEISSVKLSSTVSPPPPSASHLLPAAVAHGAQRGFEPLVLLVLDFGVAGQLLLVLPRQILPESLELLLFLLVPLGPLLC